MWKVPLLMVVVGAAQVAEPTTSDKTSIHGRWLLVALERDGVRTTSDKNVNNVEIMFGADGTYAVRTAGFDFPGRYRADAIARTLDITVDTRTVLARYELNGDELRICEGGDARPASVTSAECRRGAITLYHRRR